MMQAGPGLVQKHVGTLIQPCCQLWTSRSLLYNKVEDVLYIYLASLTFRLGIEIVQKAIEFDNQHKYAEAISLYDQSVLFLLEAVKRMDLWTEIHQKNSIIFVTRIVKNEGNYTL